MKKVELYHDSTKKLETTSDGAEVSGSITASDGFTSGTGGAVKISVSGSTLTFTVDGVGSASLTLS